VVEHPRTLGALRRSPSGAPDRILRSVKDELRENLIARLREDAPIFPGVVGYDESVVPQIVNAVLARHNFILLGLRGQAKSRILRGLASLLDDAIPGHRRQRSERQPVCANLALRTEPPG
jgi:magnesium chelatase subunit I